jgi:hypothetical protein
MKIVKESTRTMSAVNDERRQVLPSKVICDGSISHFELFNNNVEDNYWKIGAGYSFDSKFQEAFFERGVDCYVNFLGEVPSALKIDKNECALYGTLFSANQIGVGRNN